MKKLLSVVMMMTVVSVIAQSSNEKEERIKRDVEVAENVLTTLIRQQVGNRTFWGGEARGNYTPGYGVTLRIPYENWAMGGFATTVPGVAFRKSYSGNDIAVIAQEEESNTREKIERERLSSRNDNASRRDSAQNAYGEKLLAAAKMFMADYGDLIGLEPNEKILITTKSERGGGNYSFVYAGDVNFKMPKRKVISVEAIKSDLSQYKQGKISRDQLMAKFKVMNSDLSNESQPDLELLSTILGRLYRSDLSKSFFTESAPYYERMKDFGVTFYMNVYSSNETGYQRWNMPTVDLDNMTQEERDKKVKELYPLFEKDIKENMLEYGRTLNSLKDEELLILDVTLTKCKGCGIPSTIELSVKASVLKEFGSGKLTKDAAIAKINIKKGVPQ